MYFLPIYLPPSQLDNQSHLQKLKHLTVILQEQQPQAFQEVICPWATAAYKLTLILTLVHCLGLFRAGEEEVDIDVYVHRLFRPHQRKVK